MAAEAFCKTESGKSGLPPDYDAAPKKTKAGGLSIEERLSLRKFSVSFVILQAFPVFLLVVFVAIAAVKFGAVSLNQGLGLVLAGLVAFHLLMPKMAKRVSQGIMALRGTALARKAAGKRAATA